ncbi:MAG: SDR family oxidoreductase [Pseudomonadota bacterium]
MAQTFLITGANRGIGLEIARQAAGAGHRVIATARRPGDASALNDAAKATGPGVIEVVGADVTDPGQLAGIAEGEKAPIELLVCNAGQYLARGGIDDPAYSADAWQDVLMTNVAGVFFTVRAFLPHLERANRGRVAVVSSIMASSARAPGGSYIYRSSKAAVTNLARNLAMDLKAHGVAVGAYHPGWVRTDMGGTQADIDVAESASGLLARFEALDLSATGVFEDYQGKAIPY